MKVLLVVSILLGMSSNAEGQENYRQLSNEAVISLITFSPGDAFYTAFGHTAIRVNDPSLAWDAAYNYGTFDFDDPAFYLNFVRGKLNYILNVEPFDLTYRTYVYFDRGITEQILELSPDQKQRVFEYLEYNARPENRAYTYSFFYDNCSTRPRNVLRFVLKDSYSTSYSGDQRSFRDVVHERGAAQPWTRLGAQLLLGAPTDTEMDLESSAFLPDNLFYEFAEAKVDGVPLVVSTDTLYSQLSPRESNAFDWPLVFFSLLFVASLILSIASRRNPAKWHKATSWFDSILFFFTGIIGLILILIWIATSHGSTDWNINILWALPTNLVLAYFIAKGSTNKLVAVLILISIAGIILSSSLSLLGPQQFLIPLMPLVLSLMLRLASRYSAINWNHLLADNSPTTR